MAQRGVDLDIVGKWAAIIGLLLVVLGDFIGIPFTATILVILGLIVGFLNITKKEVSRLLVAGIGLLLVGTAGVELLPFVGVYIIGMLKNLVALVAPAILVVGVKEVYEVAK